MKNVQNYWRDIVCPGWEESIHSLNMSVLPKLMSKIKAISVKICMSKGTWDTRVESLKCKWSRCIKELVWGRWDVLLGPGQEGSGLLTSDRDLHVAAHETSLKIFIQVPIGSELCLKRISWVMGRLKERARLKAGNSQRRLLTEILQSKMTTILPDPKALLKPKSFSVMMDTISLPFISSPFSGAKVQRTGWASIVCLRRGGIFFLFFFPNLASGVLVWSMGKGLLRNMPRFGDWDRGGQQ